MHNIAKRFHTVSDYGMSASRRAQIGLLEGFHSNLPMCIPTLALLNNFRVSKSGFYLISFHKCNLLV